MAEPDIAVIVLLGGVAAATAWVAVQHRNLLYAVIAFAISSISLSMLFFLLASPYAAVLELVVGSGLVSVLFLVALILSGGQEEQVGT